MMMNQWTLDTLYHSVYGDPDLEQSDDICEEELYHHGVLGQSWGRRHGPPYPLDGVDKKIARAEAKRKREKERRLKKLQRAAKKARKLKKKQEKQEADTLKKKQKLVKSGDMDKIRKNADLFNNDELQYILERDAMKRGLGGEKERTTDEKFDLAMKRMGQIADIAVKGGQVFSAMKQGAEMVSAFHGVKVKELEKEEKRLSTVQKEFDLRFKRDPEEAFNYLNKELGGPKYKGEKDTKESKLEDKASRALRRERAENELKGIEDRAKQAKTDEKNAKAAEKQAKKDEKQARRDEKQAKKDEKQARRDEKQENKYLENFRLDVRGGTATQNLSGKQLDYLRKSGLIRDIEIPVSSAKERTRGMTFEAIDGSGSWGRTPAAKTGRSIATDGTYPALFGSISTINDPRSNSNWTTKSTGGSGWTRIDGGKSSKSGSMFDGVDGSGSWKRTTQRSPVRSAFNYKDTGNGLQTTGSKTIWSNTSYKQNRGVAASDAKEVREWSKNFWDKQAGKSVKLLPKDDPLDAKPLSSIKDMPLFYYDNGKVKRWF